MIERLREILRPRRPRDRGRSASGESELEIAVRLIPMGGDTEIVIMPGPELITIENTPESSSEGTFKVFDFSCHELDLAADSFRLIGEHEGVRFQYSEQLVVVLLPKKACAEEQLRRGLVSIEFEDAQEHFLPLFVASNFTFGVITDEVLRAIESIVEGEEARSSFERPRWTTARSLGDAGDNEHVSILRSGTTNWNAWVERHHNESPDLGGADLMGLELSGVNLELASLTNANLSGSNLAGAYLGRAHLHGANLSSCNLTDASLAATNLQLADLTGANMTRANLARANLNGADLSHADLSGALLLEANLSHANLSHVTLRGVNLTEALLVGTDLSYATIEACRVYGISSWDLDLEGAVQKGLMLAPDGGSGPTVTVDDLEVAQFIYLILNNRKLRNVIDTITTKVVLLLGRFSAERKPALDLLKAELRERNYCPVVFDFDGPSNRDLTETVSTLAHLSRFVIADITDARSVPQELMAIVPHLPSVPVIPLLQFSADREYGMFEHLRRFPWVLDVIRYANPTDLQGLIHSAIVSPAEAAVASLKHPRPRE